MAKKKQTPPSLERLQLIWTEEAQQALWNIWTWIAEHSEEKADAMYDEIRTKSELLLQHPHLGPVLPDAVHPETRQLIISKHYKIIYRVELSSQTLFILTIHPTRVPLSLWSDL